MVGVHYAYLLIFWHKSVFLVCLFLFCCFSCLGHKEFRFILPILPLAFVICGQFAHDLTVDVINTTNTANQSQTSSKHNGITVVNAGSNLGSRSQTIVNKLPKHGWRIDSRVLILILLLTNLPLMLYTSLIHQRGTVDVMKFVHDERRYESSYNHMSVLYLMPCHSTPYYR